MARFSEDALVVLGERYLRRDESGIAPFFALASVRRALDERPLPAFAHQVERKGRREEPL